MFEAEVYLGGLDPEFCTGRTVRRAAGREAGIQARDASERTFSSQFRAVFVFDTNAGHSQCGRLHAAHSAVSCAGTAAGNPPDRVAKMIGTHVATFADGTTRNGTTNTSQRPATLDLIFSDYFSLMNRGSWSHCAICC